MQKTNLADSRAYGEPRNGILNKEDILDDKIVVCPTCEGNGRLPRVRLSQPEGEVAKEQFITKVEEVTTNSDTLTKSSQSSTLSKATMHLTSSKRNVDIDENCSMVTIPIHFSVTSGVDCNRNERLMRRALLKLSSPEWEMIMKGLEECAQIAQHNPDEMGLHMNQVYHAMRGLLTNHRPRDTIFVCHVARTFFARLRSTCKPEFDELVITLLARTADSSIYTKCYVNDALDKMVTYIPTLHAIRPLADKGCRHKNPLVRTSAVRLLTDIVRFRTPTALLTYPHMRESCKKIIDSGALLLADNSLGTRAAAKNLFSTLVNEEGFERMFEACSLDEALKKRIVQTISALKDNKQVES